jgi:hypothetical protein
MKYLISILLLSMCAGCASRKTPPATRTQAISGTSISRKSKADVRTPEIVKAYSAGRYVDSTNPDTMHERHTIYRREQAPDWNFLPDPPVTLPTTGTSNASTPTQNAAERQRMYAEALQEQNRAMKQRLDTLQNDAGRVPALEKELDRLKKEIRQSPPPETPAAPPEPQSPDDIFSALNPGLPVADELTESSTQSQDFLFSQMRINDQFAAELEKAEKRQSAAAFNNPFLRQRELAVLKTKKP